MHSYVSHPLNSLLLVPLHLGSTVKGRRAELILWRTQNQLSKRIRQVHFTSTPQSDQTDSGGTSPILEEVPKFVDKAQLAQHIKGKDRQLPKFHTLQKGLAPSLLLDVSLQGGT